MAASVEKKVSLKDDRETRKNDIRQCHLSIKFDPLGGFACYCVNIALPNDYMHIFVQHTDLSVDELAL